MKLTSILGAVIGALALTTSAFAYPSLLGPTGGANLPVAAVVGQGKIDVAVDEYFVNDNNLKDATITRLLLGVTPNLEIGATYTAQAFQGVDSSDTNWDTYGLNAKYLLINNPKSISMGVGAVYQKFPNVQPVSVDFTQLYGVVTAKLVDSHGALPAVRGSLGVNWTRGRTTIDGVSGEATASATRPYVNVDLAFPIAHSHALRLLWEYQAKDDQFDDEAITSLTARLPLSNLLSAEVGTSNADRGVMGGPKQHLFVGANLAFGS